MKEKLPYIKWYFADWIRDTRSLSLEERGAWVDLLSMMHDGEPYGHLAIKNSPRSLENISKILGITPKKTEKILKNLEKNGMFSRTNSGIIYCRKMVREHYLRMARGTGGAKGGNPNIPRKDNLTFENKDNLKVNLPLDNLESRSQILDAKEKDPPFINTSPQKKSGKKNPENRPDIFILPDDIPEKPWNAWMEIRKHKKAKNTDYAKYLLVKKLRSISANTGRTIISLIEQAIERNWTGIEEDWVIKTGGKNVATSQRNGNRPQTFREIDAENEARNRRNYLIASGLLPPDGSFVDAGLPSLPHPRQENAGGS